MLKRQDKLTIALLSTAHFVADAYSSFLLPLLPLLAARLGLTPARAGLLIPTMMVTSSLMQPVYGMISDRYLKRSMSVFGPLVAAVCLSSIGLAGSLPGLLALVIIGGMGIGAFHPQSAALVSRAGGAHRSTVMSIFSSAGTVGVAVGPILITTVVALYGLDRSYYTAVFGVIIWVLLLRYCPALGVGAEPGHERPLGQALRAVWGPLTLLYLAAVLRSAVHVSASTYLPFLLEGGGLRLTEIGWVLSGFIFFGGVGGLFGGALADRWGARRVSLLSLLISGPVLALAFASRGWPGYVLLAVGGTFLNVAVPINVVMAQRLVPGGASTVSALMMGFAWGAGALLAPLTGVLSGHIGFARALTAICVLPPVAAALLWQFPRDAATQPKKLFTDADPCRSAPSVSSVGHSSL
ncbi:MAG TPA: MFS transporter [Blastocatellia bacterium]|nr:MFS transporter [Blastocatellia bacterium]